MKLPREREDLRTILGKHQYLDVGNGKKNQRRELKGEPREVGGKQGSCVTGAQGQEDFKKVMVKKIEYFPTVRNVRENCP